MNQKFHFSFLISSSVRKYNTILNCVSTKILFITQVLLGAVDDDFNTLTLIPSEGVTPMHPQKGIYLMLKLLLRFALAKQTTTQ